jgi:UDP-N-acetylmuramoyl-L-alanyl-D-glutamate--2,6-diaminopimelate ligase
MQIRELISESNVLAVHGSAAIDIAGIAHDARRVLPGDLYVAIQRETADGHSEIELALERGAVAIVTRRRSTLRHRVTQIEVADTRLALAELSSIFYGHPGKKLHVIAVSGGPDGWKIAHLTKQILEAGGVKAGLICSMRHEIGERNLPASQFTEPSDLQRLFSGMVRSGCSACVIELPAISPVYLKGIPVNVLLYHGGEQNLRALALFLDTRKDSPVCGIVNVDEESGRAVAYSNLFKMQLAYGFQSQSDVGASDVCCTSASSRFVLNLAGHSALCEVPLVGKTNIRHFLAAAAASLSVLTPRQVNSACAAVRPVPGSLEAVFNQNGLSIFVDEAAAPESLFKVLEDISRLKTGRVLLAFGCAAGTTGKHRFDIGRTAAQFADHVIVTSDNPGNELPEQICSVVAQGIESVGRGRYHVELDREQAIRELIAMAEPGDVVLITGKGERSHQILADTIVPFNDRTVATQILQNFVKPIARPLVEPALCAA